MMNNKIWLGVLVIIMIFGLLIGCDTGTNGLSNQQDTSDDGSGDGSGGGSSGGSGGGQKSSPQTAIYARDNYELIISEKVMKNISRAGYVPQSGDTYILKIGGVEKSSGTVSVAGSDFTFTPLSGKPSFTATFEYGALRDIGQVTLDDNTKVTLPNLIDQNNTSGNASTPAEDTETTIAGCAYSNKVQESGTFIWSYEHYLLTVPYEQALSALKKSWGEPDETTEKNNCSILNGSGEAAAEARQNGGVLFEVTNYDYRLAVWAEVTVGGTTTGAWSVAIWHRDEERTEPQDTETTIGELAYSQKDGDSGSTQWSSTHYLLSIPYDEALSIFEKLWGPPLSGLFLYRGSTLSNQASQSNGVIFEDVTMTWGGDYRLCRFVNGQWEVVSWYKAWSNANDS
jgi:hypothetical protein